ncbi:hypothetical protein [Nonomuraea sp. NPDC001831]|uniref:hypothetical protein n=1 Tax=Nonomuraea sp. NPDC001831 TaxID=3364340 RepID=UPI00368FC427
MIHGRWYGVAVLTLLVAALSARLSVAVGIVESEAGRHPLDGQTAINVGFRLQEAVVRRKSVCVSPQPAVTMRAHESPS